MASALKLAAAILTGTFTGSFVWLWLTYGSQVFVTYAEAFLAWCL